MNEIKEPNFKSEIAWSMFKCMFALCLLLSLLIGGLFAYYMHGSFSNVVTTDITQTSDGDYTKNNQNIYK